MRNLQAFQVLQNVFMKVKLSVFFTLSLLAATCRLLITFANNLDPVQDRRSGSKPSDTLIVFLKELF